MALAGSGMGAAAAAVPVEADVVSARHSASHEGPASCPLPLLPGPALPWLRTDPSPALGRAFPDAPPDGAVAASAVAMCDWLEREKMRENVKKWIGRLFETAGALTTRAPHRI